MTFDFCMGQQQQQQQQHLDNELLELSLISLHLIQKSVADAYMCYVNPVCHANRKLLVRCCV